jgi:deazaflavin-dependent oxidoreductase (nitroreductase family)
MDDRRQLVRANAVQRTMQRLASLRPVAFVFRHTFHHLDRVLLRVLGGRTLSSIIAGVPNILLTTTGARTGRARTVPVIGLPVDGGLAIVGTRFGSPTNPGWYHNLSHDPHARVTRRDETTDVVARLVPDGAEYDAIMRVADSVYCGFPKYRRRITTRRVPVFVLEPA